MARPYFAAALLAAVALFPALPRTTAAEAFSEGPVTVSNAWTRASLTSVAAAYVTIRTRGPAAERLLRATTPAARRIEIHRSRIDGKGVMHMDQIEDGVAIRPGTPVTLKPGGIHLMLVGLKTPLKKGTMVPITLHFKGIGALTIPFHVLGPGSGGPAKGHH